MFCFLWKKYLQLHVPWSSSVEWSIDQSTSFVFQYQAWYSWVFFWRNVFNCIITYQHFIFTIMIECQEINDSVEDIVSLPVTQCWTNSGGDESLDWVRGTSSCSHSEWKLHNKIHQMIDRPKSQLVHFLSKSLYWKYIQCSKLGLPGSPMPRSKWPGLWTFSMLLAQVQTTF